MSEEISFKEKLKSIQWGVSTRNPGTLKNYYDNEAIEEAFGGVDAREEYLDTMEGIPLKWSGDTPYYKDKVGDYVQADEKVMKRVMYGSGKSEEESRSFSLSSGRKPSGGSKAS